jgi:hypothetical protein
MRDEGRTRREVFRALTAAVASAVALLAGSPAGAGGASGVGPPRDPEGRRRWALARMDEMAQERLRCRARFPTPRQVRDCEAEFERRHRAYNEVYREAARQ